jgi:hypothetical protein
MYEELFSKTSHVHSCFEKNTANQINFKGNITGPIMLRLRPMQSHDIYLSIPVFKQTKETAFETRAVGFIKKSTRPINTKFGLVLSLTKCNHMASKTQNVKFGA